MKINFLIYKILFPLCLICMTTILTVVMHYGWRIFIADTFIIPSVSMLPTLMSGDKIKVNKLIFGARIYKSLNFTNGNLECWRTRGLRKLQINDIIVFNYPINEKKMGFKINHVYIKRCVALPGDTISFIHSRPINNNYDGIIGIPEMQKELENTPDDELPWEVMWPILVGDTRLGWNVKNMGPIYVPRNGDIIWIDDQRKTDIYQTIIEFETKKGIQWDKEKKICISEKTPLYYYQFKRNYYFVCGDNAPNSQDSRYWGFVPEEYIVGVATEVIQSIDHTTGKERKQRAGLNLLYKTNSK